jgi:LPS-assembly lipoprotein
MIPARACLPLLLASIALGSCALQPLYGGGRSGPVAQTLAAVDVGPIEGEAGWLVRSALTDRLRASGASPGANARYRVNVTLDDTITGFGVRADESVTRERRTLRARWQLVDTANGATLLDRSATVDAGIDVVGSEFATIAAERSALEHLAGALADQIATRIALFARQRPADAP